MPQKSTDKPAGASLVQVNNRLPHTLTSKKRGKSQVSGQPGPVLFDFTLKGGENMIQKEQWELALKHDRRLQARIERGWITTGPLARLARLDLYEGLAGPMDRGLIRKLSSKAQRIKDEQLLDANADDTEIFMAQVIHAGPESALRAQLERMEKELAELRALQGRPASTGIVTED